MFERETHISGAVLGAAVAVIQALLQARGLFLRAPQRQELTARVHIRVAFRRLSAQSAVT